MDDMSTEDIKLIPTGPSREARFRVAELERMHSDSQATETNLAKTYLSWVFKICTEGAHATLVDALDVGEVLLESSNAELRAAAARFLEVMPIEYQVPRWWRSVARLVLDTDPEVRGSVAAGPLIDAIDLRVEEP